jgi:prolyl oligopeptidase
MPVVTVSPDPVVDILHGVPVADPYRRLEDHSSPETESWIVAQKQLHDDYFSRVPGMSSLRSRVECYLDIETVEQPSRVENRYFFRRRKKGEEQACLWVRDIQSGIERMLVDPSPFGKFIAVAISRISDDGKMMAYEQRNGGERTATIHFVDVVSGEVLKESLYSGYLRGLDFDSPITGFYYCHETPEDIHRFRQHEIRFHAFGSSLSSDRVLLSAPRTDRSRMSLIADERNLGAVLSREVDGEMRVDLYCAKRSRDEAWTPIFVNHRAPYGPLFHNGCVYVICPGSGSRGQIVALNDDGSERQILIPEGDALIHGFQFFGNKIIVSYLVNLEPVVHVWDLDGTFLGVLPTPKEGSFDLLRSRSMHNESVFFVYESFHQSPSVLEMDQNHLECGVLAKPNATLDKSRFKARRMKYLSRDGTEIPIYLIEPRQENTRTPRPTVLTAYGGFGMNMTPRFSALVAIMLELGAVFALPNIRGGGEFGRAWHEAARARRRQVAFDDFICAAEWLRDRHITSGEGIAIFGGSNSGLLVGAAMTQRPDLFKAVLCMAPILDMVRYEQFGDAAKAKSEFGTVTDIEDFHALYAYSPYHRVADEVNYPATLFVSGDKDTVCDPAHTRKMAARLQGRSAQSNPILVDYSPNRGHTAVLPLSVRIDALTRRIAFLCHQLKISIPEESLHDSSRA